MSGFRMFPFPAIHGKGWKSERLLQKKTHSIDDNFGVVLFQNKPGFANKRDQCFLIEHGKRKKKEKSTTETWKFLTWKNKNPDFYKPRF